MSEAEVAIAEAKAIIAGYKDLTLQLRGLEFYKNLRIHSFRGD